MAEVVEEETNRIQGAQDQAVAPEKSLEEKMDISRLWWTKILKRQPAMTQLVTHCCNSDVR